MRVSRESEQGSIPAARRVSPSLYLELSVPAHSTPPPTAKRHHDMVMDVKNLSDLNKIAVLCRKRGIESIKIGADFIEFKLSPDAPASTYKRKQDAVDENIETVPAYSEDAALFWSSSGIPEARAS